MASMLTDPLCPVTSPPAVLKVFITGQETAPERFNTKSGHANFVNLVPEGTNPFHPKKVDDKMGSGGNLGHLYLNRSAKAFPQGYLGFHPS